MDELWQEQQDEQERDDSDMMYWYQVGQYQQQDEIINGNPAPVSPVKQGE